MWSRACGAGVLGGAWLIACAALPVAPLDGPEGDAAAEASTGGDAEPATTDDATTDSAARDADAAPDADADAAPEADADAALDADADAP